MRIKLICAVIALLLLAPAPAAAALAPDQDHGVRGTARYDGGVYTAFCLRSAGASTRSRAPLAPPEASEGDAREEPVATKPREDEEADAEPPSGPWEAGLASAASTSHAGWPAKECLKMDKGRAGRRQTLVGLNGVHNWLLGGYGNDTIIGGDRGDVIWADYHPSGEPRFQTALIRAGDGRNVIYANDTRNYVWTGSNPRTVVHAHVTGVSGVIHCQSPGIVVYLSTVSERHFTLDGCKHVSHYSVGY